MGTTVAPRPKGSSFDSWQALLPLIAIGVAIRILLSPHAAYPFDMRAFLSWTRYLATNPLSSFYGTRFFVPPDHLPGDMILFAGIGRLTRLVDPSFEFRGENAELIIRIIPMVSDIVLGVLAWAFFRKIDRPGIPILAASLVILNPAMFMVSAVWGQWDSFAAFLLIAALILAIRGHTIAVWPLLMYLVLIKPQYVIFVVLILISLLRVLPTKHDHTTGVQLRAHRSFIRDLGAGAVLSAIVFLACCLPFGVGLPHQPGSTYSIFDRVNFAVNRYDDITLGAQNVWSLFGKRIGDPDSQTLGLGLSYADAGRGLLALGLVISIVVAIKIELADWALLCSTFMASAAIYSFPTRVHERYMMPTFVVLFFMWPRVRLLLVPIIGLSATYSLSLWIAMQGTRDWNPQLLDVAVAMTNLSLFSFAAITMLVSASPKLSRLWGRRVSEQGRRDIIPLSPNDIQEG